MDYMIEIDAVGVDAGIHFSRKGGDLRHNKDNNLVYGYGFCRW
jgi:hypothetical protein